MEKEQRTELVRQAKLGDENSPEAFGKLYEEIYTGLYKTALCTLGNPQDAENAVADAVLDAYAGIGKLKNDEAFTAWIYRILGAKLKRKEGEYANRRKQEAPESVEEYAECLPAEEETEPAGMSGPLREALKVLSPTDRAIIALIIWAQLDSGEVARVLGLNRVTVRSKYSRALRKLRDELEKKGFEKPGGGSGGRTGGSPGDSPGKKVEGSPGGVPGDMAGTDGAAQQAQEEGGGKDG